MNLPYALWLFAIGVSPFGYPRIEAYLQLPVAFRSLSRPSSAPDAKAFTLCSFSLELSDRRLSAPSLFSELLEFHKQIENFAVQRFSFTPFLPPGGKPPCGEIVFTLFGKTNSNLLKFVLSNLFVSTLQYALFGFQ